MVPLIYFIVWRGYIRENTVPAYHSQPPFQSIELVPWQKEGLSTQVLVIPIGNHKVHNHRLYLKNCPIPVLLESPIAISCISLSPIITFLSIPYTNLLVKA